MRTSLWDSIGRRPAHSLTIPKEFVKSINTTLSFSTSKKIVVKSYTLLMNKVEIIKLGKAIGVNFDLIWSCYRGGQKPCGTCESCLRLKIASTNFEKSV